MRKASYVILILSAGIAFGFYLGSNWGEAQIETVEPFVDTDAGLDTISDLEEPIDVPKMESDYFIKGELADEKLKSAKLEEELSRALEALSALEESNRTSSEFTMGGDSLVRFDAEKGILEIESNDLIEVERGRKFIVGKTAEIAGDLKSATGKEKATLHFKNTTQDPVYLMWINYQGKPVPYDKIEPGAKSVRPTYMTHPWVIVDLEGNRLGDVEPVHQDTVEEIVIEN